MKNIRIFLNENFYFFLGGITFSIFEYACFRIAYILKYIMILLTDSVGLDLGLCCPH